LTRIGLKSEEGIDQGPLSRAEFEAQHGIPPWDFLNGLLERGNYDFRATRPEPGPDDLPFTVQLEHQVNGELLGFDDLSSGERILMALAMCVYSTEDGRIRVNYPKMMLFDEVDAPLHPSMITDLLSTLKTVLVDTHKIKVIMTTHSPTTAALATDAAMIEMRKTEPRLVETSRIDAVRSLSEDVPELTVRVDNRRLVFVESQHDAQYYDALSATLAGWLRTPIVSVFQSSGYTTKDKARKGDGKANVKYLVNSLTKTGIQDVYGLCDGDGAGKGGSDRLLHLGDGRRHSIENYVFDPLLIALLLNKNKWWDQVTPEDMGLKRTNHIWCELDQADAATLQTAADAILSVVGPPGAVTTTGSRTARLAGGGKLRLPIWFLEEQGHRWLARARSAIPQLNKLGTDHEALMTIINQVVDRVPELTSKDICDSLNQLRK
jgi:hypothetical protein